jgi:gamma-glutamylcyclotransferase (GGCT)/AIG2-like uncharacterized protein YtfP
VQVAPPAAGAPGGSAVEAGARLVVTHHLFVYGTLRPGEVRWQHLAPFVVGEGEHTTVAGDVFDTGLHYPAARFGGAGRINGRVYELTRLDDALAHLDEVEGAVRGLYRRVTVETASGHLAWAYECGEDALLVRHLAHGDWLLR